MHRRDEDRREMERKIDILLHLSKTIFRLKTVLVYYIKK
jgi:hypothetical protein